jgi:homoserine dehydrogenase
MSSAVWQAATPDDLGFNLDLDTVHDSRADIATRATTDTNRWARPGVRRIRVGLLGCGRIGQAVMATARAERERLAAAGIELTFVRALVRDTTKPRATIVPCVDSAEEFEVEDLDVVIEVLGGVEPARTIVARALAAGVSVVTANKTLVAHAGAELEQVARRHGAVLAYDAAVLAGVPFLGSLARRPLLSGAHRLAGIVNGTSHAITTALEANVPFSQAVADAVERGYAEPDSSADTSGRDAAEKLTILLRLAGVTTTVSELTTIGIEGLVPHDFFLARELGGTLKPIALAALADDQPGAWVGPAFVQGDSPIARATGVTNVLQISGAAGRTALDVPDVIFQGPGAGAEATAATIIDDVAEAIEELTPSRRAAGRRATCDVSQPPVGPWFIRLAASDGRSVDRGTLASLGLPLVSLALAPTSAAAITVPASWRNVQRATALARGRGFATIAFPAIR